MSFRNVSLLFVSQIFACWIYDSLTHFENISYVLTITRNKLALFYLPQWVNGNFFNCFLPRIIRNVLYASLLKTGYVILEIPNFDWLTGNGILAHMLGGRVFFTMIVADVEVFLWGWF